MNDQINVVPLADDAVEAIELDVQARQTWVTPTLKKLSVSELTAGGATSAGFESGLYSTS